MISDKFCMLQLTRGLGPQALEVNKRLASSTLRAHKLKPLRCYQPYPRGANNHYGLRHPRWHLVRGKKYLGGVQVYPVRDAILSPEWATRSARKRQKQPVRPEMPMLVPHKKRKTTSQAALAHPERGAKLSPEWEMRSTCKRQNVIKGAWSTPKIINYKFKLWDQ